MAKHKAPTEVTLVPTEERRGFALWVETYWKPAAALAVVATIAILAMQYLGQKKELAKDQSWARLSSTIEGAEFGGILGEPAEVRAAVDGLSGTIAEPWGRYVLALSLREEDHYEDSVQALEQLRSADPDSFLVKERYVFGSDTTPRSPVEQLMRVVADEGSWRAAHPMLFANPEPPADAPKVRIVTDKGNILLELYPDQAPKHVENFLELCRTGFYAGTKFHRLTKGQMIEGGDPNTREGDATTWGQGSNGGTLPPEPNGLYHFAGVISAAKPAAGGEGSDCLFRITTQPAHHIDESSTAFGRVVEGMDVIEAIEAGELIDTVRFQPVTPVAIQSTDVLEG